MRNYGASHGAVGKVFGEYEITYKGQPVTVLDRIRVHGRCQHCKTRWTPSSLDELNTCPEADSHEYGDEVDPSEFDVPMVTDEVGESDNPLYMVELDESYVEEFRLDDGRTFSAGYEPVIRCEHCDYEWATSSSADRPSCAACHRKTDRDTIGKHYKTYLKYALFDGEERSAAEVSDRLRQQAILFELLEVNGWHFDGTTQSSHVTLSKGNAPPQDII